MMRIVNFFFRINEAAIFRTLICMLKIYIGKNKLRKCSLNIVQLETYIIEDQGILNGPIKFCAQCTMTYQNAV